MKSNNVTIDELTKISRSLPKIERNESYDEKTTQEAFERIQSLEPEIFNHADYLVRDSNLQRILISTGEPAIKYIEPTLSVFDRDVIHNSISILINIGEPSLSLLSTTLNSSNDHRIRSAAANGLAELGDLGGYDILKNALVCKDKAVIKSSVDGLVGYMHIRINIRDEIETELIQKYLYPVMPFLKNPDPWIRGRVLNVIVHIKRISVLRDTQLFRELNDDEYLKTIDTALDDNDFSVRETALHGLRLLDIDKSNADVLVKVFEDKSGELSNEAIYDMFSKGYSSKSVSPEAVSNSIFDVLIIRSTGRPSDYINPDIVVNAFNEIFKENPRLYTQTLQKLRDLSYEHNNDIRMRCVFVAKRLKEDEFIALVNAKSNDNPLAAKKIYDALGIPTESDAIAEELSGIEPGDVQRIVSAQIKLLGNYNQDALEQARTSFRWAIASTIASFIILVGVLVYLIVIQSQNLVSILAGISALIAQLLSGTQFYLYRRSQEQVAYFHKALNQTQTFMLANSVCEGLEGEYKQKARSDLVKSITQIGLLESNSELEEE